MKGRFLAASACTSATSGYSEHDVMLAHPEAVHVSRALDRHDREARSLAVARSTVDLVAALTSEYVDIIDEIAGSVIEVGGVVCWGRGLPSAPSSMSSRHGHSPRV